MILRKLGDLLEVNLQLWDGAASQPKRVFVDLKRIDGTLLTPRFEILHKGDGLYAEEIKTMPIDNIILASLLVFESDGVTLSTTHTIGQETYMRDLIGEIISANLDIPVSSLDKLQSDISGNLELLEIVGTIDNIEIIGTIDNGNTEIIGVVE